MKHKVDFRPMQDSDYSAVAEIFQQGIDGGNATFETAPPNWERWNQDHFKVGRWVAVVAESNDVIGWAALSYVSNRNVFRGVAELSIYIHDRFHGKGVGKKLMEILIRDSEENGIWLLQSGVFPENIASIKLHEKLGFRHVGFREKIGQMPNTNKWRDILILERRSNTIV